jgi:hypothetical protein
VYACTPRIARKRVDESLALAAKQTDRMDHLRAALADARNGFSVFPLAPRSKLPLISADKGGHGLREATTDLDQIRACGPLSRSPASVCRPESRSTWWILDSLAAVDALEAAEIAERVIEPVVATAKGFHYLVAPTGLGNKAGVLPGVELCGHAASLRP